MRSALSRGLPLLLMAVGVVALQLGISASGRTFYMTQLIMALYYTLVVLGLCLVMGYAGQVSLGHGGFFAIGGYTSALLTTLDLSPHLAPAAQETLTRIGLLSVRTNVYGVTLVTVSPWPAFLAALVLTAVIALVLGFPSLRLKGHYLAMATLGFVMIVYRILLGSRATGFADGITGVPAWRLAPGLTVTGGMRDRVMNYYIAWGVVLLALALLRNLVASRHGRALRSIHDSETAANAMGVNTPRLKLQAFVISAVLAAAAGSFLTHYSGGIGPSEADAMKSVRYLTLVAAGGMANLWGSLFVSIILTFLSLRGVFGSYDHAVFGAILIAIISFAPNGPLHLASRLLHRRRRKAAVPDEPEPEAVP